MYQTSNLTKVTTKMLPIAVKDLAVRNTDNRNRINMYSTTNWKNESIGLSVCETKGIFFILKASTNCIDARSLYEDKILSTWTCIPNITCMEFDHKSSKLIVACGFGNIATVDFDTEKLKFGQDKIIRGIHCDLALKIFVNPFPGEKNTVYIGLMYHSKIYKVDHETGEVIITNIGEPDTNLKVLLKKKQLSVARCYVLNYQVKKVGVLIPE